MKVFLDTNVVLDLLLDDRAGRADAEEIFALGAYGDIQIVISPITFANAAYLLEKALGASPARENLRLLSRFVSVSTDDEVTVDQAFAFSDRPAFEDALQYTSASSVGAEVIVTSNTSDFGKAALTVQTPTEFLRDI